MSEYEVFKKILESGDLEEIKILLPKVFKDKKIIDLFIEKFEQAQKEVLEEEEEPLKVQVNITIKMS